MPRGWLNDCQLSCSLLSWPRVVSGRKLVRPWFSSIVSHLCIHPPPTDEQDSDQTSAVQPIMPSSRPIPLITPHMYESSASTPPYFLQLLQLPTELVCHTLSFLNMYDLIACKMVITSPLSS